MWQLRTNEYTTFEKIEEYMKGVNRMPGERPIILSRQKRLVRLCEEGLLLPFRVAVIELSNGTRYRMDGQLSMWLYENGHVPPIHPVSLDISDGDDMGDARGLYCHFDHTNSSRNAADVAGAWMTGSNSFVAARRYDMALLSKGMARASIGGYPKRKGEKLPSPAECGKLARESKQHREFAQAFIGFANDARWLWKLPIVVAARLMWDRSDEDKFYGFFNLLLEATASTGNAKYCPAGQLFRALVVNKQPGRKTREIFFATDKCMRAFEDGRMVKTVRYSGSKDTSATLRRGRRNRELALAG